MKGKRIGGRRLNWEQFEKRGPTALRVDRKKQELIETTPKTGASCPRPASHATLGNVWSWHLGYNRKIDQRRSAVILFDR
jgi:hypothetical protein